MSIKLVAGKLHIIAFGRGHVYVGERAEPSTQLKFRAELAADAAGLLTRERAERLLAVAKLHKLDEAVMKYAEAVHYSDENAPKRDSFIENYLAENLVSQEVLNFPDAYTMRVWGNDSLGFLALKGPTSSTQLDAAPVGLAMPGAAIHAAFMVNEAVEPAWRELLSKTAAALLR
jgi:hypothetical protein